MQHVGLQLLKHLVSRPLVDSPRKEHVQFPEPEELRPVLTHGRPEDRPVSRPCDVDDAAQQETHRDVQKGRVLAQHVDGPQRVHRDA